MQVVYTLRDDLYWSYYHPEIDEITGNAFTRFLKNLFGRKQFHQTMEDVKVTSDDVIFWYDEIIGDPDMLSSGYNSQFVTMPDGSEERITITKIDDLRFSFNFPRIIADPYLFTNMTFGPKHIYQPAKLRGGADEVRNIHNISVDPRTIPSMSEWFLVEYSPGQRLVYRSNPNFWKRDSVGNSMPYMEEMIIRIIREENTHLLLFKNGSIDAYRLRPEDINPLVTARNQDYTIFNNEGALNAGFWTFNQNPVNNETPQYEWFTKKEFRQAMSCLLNRDRINVQVYRGLAQPKLDFFPAPNPFYNPDIKNQFLFDTDRAIYLLSSIGINRDSAGVMRDWANRPIEFDLSIRSESSIMLDIASIIMDELSKVGIRVNIRVLDFQKLVEQLFTSFEWESMIMALSGLQIFPTQGSNVWPSDGNLHLWHPNQESPATEWEARIDFLYNEGKFTIDFDKAKEIWDEFQLILNDQLPWIYLMRPRGFFAMNNRWDFSNVFFDNVNSQNPFGAEVKYVFLSE
jgi:peptide/nickel transport system substrate-binding protein